MEYARLLKYDVLESLKGYVILTGDSILNQFKSGDSKGTLQSVKKKLKDFLSRVCGKNFKEDSVKAVIEFFR